MKKITELPWGIPLLVALAALVTGGYYVSRSAPSLAAEFSWDYPVAGGCYTKEAEGFIVRVISDGVPVATDTVFTNSWIAPTAPGSYQIKVASLWTDGAQLKVGHVAAPDCTALPDTLWSEMSDPPVVVEAQSGLVTNLRVQLGIAK